MKRYIKSSHQDVDFYGQHYYDKYHEVVRDELSGMVISKRVEDEDEPGGLAYEAETVGISDPFDLLECLEGMCHEGEAIEISDYQYKVL